MIYLQGYSSRFDAKPKQNLKEYNSLMGRIIKVEGPPGEVLKCRAAVPYPLACPSFSHQLLWTPPLRWDGRKCSEWELLCSPRSAGSFPLQSPSPDTPY